MQAQKTAAATLRKNLLARCCTFLLPKDVATEHGLGTLTVNITVVKYGLFREACLALGAQIGTERNAQITPEQKAQAQQGYAHPDGKPYKTYSVSLIDQQLAGGQARLVEEQTKAHIAALNTLKGKLLAKCSFLPADAVSKPDPFGVAFRAMVLEENCAAFEQACGELGAKPSVVPNDNRVHLIKPVGPDHEKEAGKIRPL